MARRQPVHLGDVAELVRGVSYRPKDLLTGDSESFPLLRATNIRDRALELTDVLYVPPELVRNHQLLRCFDVVIAMSSGSRAAVGRLAQLRQDWTGCVGAFCGVIRPDPRRVHPEYLGYVLHSPEFRTRIETYAVGTAIMNLSRDRILGFSLQLPDIPEQRAIAHILGTLDDKIELNRRMSETLEAMARALFKSWFVNFDPVRAKVDGRDPGLPQPLADLFPSRLFDSELGEIPEGWEVGGFEELAEVTSGKRPEGRFPIPSAGASIPLWGGNGPMAFVAEPLFSEPLLLTGRVGTLGSVFRISGPCWPSDNTLVVRAKRPANYEYLFLQLRLIDFASLNRGSTQPLLTQSDLKSQRLLIADTAVLEQFSRIAGSMYKRIDKNKEESYTLAALRDVLLPKLISGELRVADIECFIGRII